MRSFAREERNRSPSIEQKNLAYNYKEEGQDQKFNYRGKRH